MATDTFRKHTRSLTSPPEHAAAVLPEDGADLPHVTRALYVGGGGDITVRMYDGDVVTLTGVPGGTFLPIRVVGVLATGTSASALVGLW